MRPNTLKNAKSVENLKVGGSEKGRERRSRHGREKPIAGQRISRAFNQGMENRTLKQTSEKAQEKKCRVYVHVGFMDLKKAYDRVNRKAF